MTLFQLHEAKMGAKRKYSDRDIEAAVRPLFLLHGGVEHVTANMVRKRLGGGDRQRVKEILERMKAQQTILKSHEVNTPPEFQTVVERALGEMGKTFDTLLHQVSNEKAARATAHLSEKIEELESRLERQRRAHNEEKSSDTREILRLEQTLSEVGSINRELERRAKDAERSASDLQKQLSKKDAAIARLEQHRTASKIEIRTLKAALKTTRSSRAA